MSYRLPSIATVATVTAGLLFTSGVTAHHGWSWAEPEQMQLTGTVKNVSIAPPHPSLDIETQEGESWHIQLGNPAGTARSGFDEDSAEAGDEITVVGNRSQDRSELRMKAVQVTVDGKTYDIYPERVEQ
ncbi:hypothetical protein HG264_02250 [Pseudomonas sp. gcc21]|uniref:DUF6152 family protein n=1 Tax=Pseudomonas sp. gcc21 TaxID=2726989 RepID=UPI0014510DF4|nr:DUF6152 family protein [Pseudomonas sp. gcc21]QJD57815.1 hypothetical protein HG264_02250 [Pseudomonas sp. gcc21]